jgi:hypothetical protein
MGARVPSPSTTTLMDRPPPGPARGPFAAPSWLVALLSVALVLLAGFGLLRAYRRRAK